MTSPSRKKDYLRPTIVAMALSAIGEATYFVLWGLVLFPGGNVLAKFTWTATCVVAMGAVIGVGVAAFVMERLDGKAAALGTAFVYAAVLSACTLICAHLDRQFDYFGGASQPTLFLAAGLIPAVLSSALYAWLLYSGLGRTILQRLGF